MDHDGEPWMTEMSARRLTVVEPRRATSINGCLVLSPGIRVRAARERIHVDSELFHRVAACASGAALHLRRRALDSGEDPALTGSFRHDHELLPPAIRARLGISDQS